jgi:hypothetical protein
MLDHSSRSGEECAARYLDHLNALAAEISNAIGAIASNSLTKLQKSVASQEALCEQLWAMTNAAPRDAGSSAPQIAPAGSALGPGIQASARALHDLNLEYAALLRHSGKSLAMLAALCRSHSGALPHAPCSGIARPTWSCEA